MYFLNHRHFGDYFYKIGDFHISSVIFRLFMKKYQMRCPNICNQPQGIHFCNWKSNLTFRLTVVLEFYPIFFYDSKDNRKWGLDAKSQTSSSKTVDLHPHPNFLLFWPVNSVCGQTKGQIRFSIAEMDFLGCITYV